MNSRNNVPTVEGAYTPSNSVVIPPLRTASMSSIQSAPTHMPATTVTSFGDGLAAPDLIRGSAMWTFPLGGDNITTRGIYRRSG